MDLAGVGDMLYGKGIKLFMTNILDTEPLSPESPVCSGAGVIM